MTILASLIAVLVAHESSRAAARQNGPARKVQGNVINSERDPKVRIQLPKSVQYVGVDWWVLYDMADCELHAFVDADEQKNVQRLYWIQFEGYLPTKPKLKHKYDSPRHAKIGGLDFYVDTWVQPKGGGTRPGSDSEHIFQTNRIPSTDVCRDGGGCGNEVCASGASAR